MKSAFLLPTIAASLLLACNGRPYRAASASMENTIMVGENFYVTNTDKFERNEIAVFENYTEDYNDPIENEPGKWKKKWQRMVYRIAALSGDSLEIRNGELYVNGANIRPAPSSKSEYQLYAKNPFNGIDEEQLATALIGQKGDTTIYTLVLTYTQATELKKNPAVFNIQRLPIPHPSVPDTIYARSSAEDNWTLDDYGPLRIPAPGNKIIVTSANFNLYKNIPGIETTGEHTIKEKLYFLIGDNRHAAMDSRFIGFIAHSKMIGIVKKE